MFSQNVFSAKDVLGNLTFCDSNTWDSQPYSQVNSCSQNSQFSSIELFSQPKESQQSRFDQSQQSQIQNMSSEDDPSNYYNKYLNNPPLFHGTSDSNRNLAKPILQKDMIEAQKRNICIREERDMLQIFINLLKDYSKEVDSSFQTFKDYMEKSFQEIKKSVSDGAHSCNDNLKALKEELNFATDKTEKYSEEKQRLERDHLEQTSTIKVLESKVGILEKQLIEAKDKESAYADQKTKYYELEQLYLQSRNNCDLNQGSFLGNTPPLSQQTDPLCSFLVSPLRQNGPVVEKPYSGNYTVLANQVPLLTTSYDLNMWESGNMQSNRTGEYYNSQVMNAFQSDSALDPSTTIRNPISSALSCEYVSSGSMAHFQETTYLPSTSFMTYKQQNGEPKRFEMMAAEKNHDLRKRLNDHSQSNSQKSNTSLIVRRSTKRPKQSPMAMVRPQMRHYDQHSNDDDIFVCGVKNNASDEQKRSDTTRALTSALPLCSVEQSKSLKNKNMFSRGMLADKENSKQISKDKDNLRRQESVRRNVSLVSMLGMSNDDLEVQEITNSIKAQQRKLAKRIKSLS